MQEFVRQAKSILNIYLQRGQAATQALAEGRIEDAAVLLKKRNAAFHNFRIVDAQILAAENAGELASLSTDPEVQDLLAQMRAVDQQLQPLLAAAHAQTAALAQRLRDAQQKIGHYRSGATEQTQFEQSA